MKIFLVYKEIEGSFQADDHRAACGDERDADIIVAVAIDELERLRAYVASEPARLAAAREEQREADARSCRACKGDGFVMRVRECPFCNDSTHDHECPTDRLKVSCGCNAAAVRATPLTATPLADKIAALRADLASALADRDEAIAALLEMAQHEERALLSELPRLCTDDEDCIHCERLKRARAILAKHLEGK